MGDSEPPVEYAEMYLRSHEVQWHVEVSTLQSEQIKSDQHCSHKLPVPYIAL